MCDIIQYNSVKKKMFAQEIFNNGSDLRFEIKTLTGNCKILGLTPPPLIPSDGNADISSSDEGEIFVQTFDCNSTLDDSGCVLHSSPL